MPSSTTGRSISWAASSRERFRTSALEQEGLRVKLPRNAIRRWIQVIPLSTILVLSVASFAVTADEPAAQVEVKKPKLAPPPVEPPAQSRTDQNQKERLDFFVPRLRELRMHYPSEPTRPVTFVEGPLFRFENPISFISDGFMFVWTDHGRPVVAMKCYYNGSAKSWGRTFVSLAERQIVLESGKQKLWTPEAAAAFAPLPDAPRPADRPNLRLTQMRKLAERFQVVDHWGLKDPTDWQLRLLNTPLYRYDVPDEKVLDGAMFGYVLTGSPEALVLFEARESHGELTWHYAVSRFTRFGIDFSLDDRKLTAFPRLDAWPPTGAYFHHPLPMPDYPFTKSTNATEVVK
jgi:hypothetical protein